MLARRPRLHGAPMPSSVEIHGHVAPGFERIEVVGALKSAARPLPADEAELAALRENASVLLEKLRPGVAAKKLRIANSSLQTLRNVLEEL